MSDFAHRLPIDSIRDGDRLDLVADESERAAVAKRLDLVALDRLEAHVTLHRDGRTVRCDGRVKAQLAQACIASGEPVPGAVDEPFALAFMPAPQIHEPEAEIELGQADLDTVFHDGAAIDLGDAITDTLGLALDPYPRGPDAEAALKAAGVMSEGEAGPFAILAKLKASPDQP
ncbi:MAG: DUF177 domain-containing protein [Sphingomicrobium sp.]